MVVFPALSSPSTKIRASLSPKMLRRREIQSPIWAEWQSCGQLLYALPMAS